MSHRPRCMAVFFLTLSLVVAVPIVAFAQDRASEGLRASPTQRPALSRQFAGQYGRC